MLSRIRNLRLSDPSAELNRLLRNSAICDRLDRLNIYHFNEFDLSDQFHRIALARSFEIYETLKESHYVLHHSQKFDFLPFNIVNNLLLSLGRLHSLKAFETVLRHPLDFTCDDLDSFGIEAFVSRINRLNTKTENDHRYTKYLIAADAHLASVAHGESALRRLTEPVAKNFCPNEQVLNRVLGYYIFDDEIKNDFLWQLQAIRDKADSGRGILYSVCIPKDYFNECAYLSLMLGIPAEVPSNEIHHLLHVMQDEVEPIRSFPQVRLLAHKLVPDKVKIFIFPAMHDQLYFELIDDAQSLIDQYKHFLNFDSSVYQRQSKLQQLIL